MLMMSLTSTMLVCLMVKDGFKIGSRVSPAPRMFSVEFDDKWDPLSCIFKFVLINSR
jgi:hypothetical protein